MIVAGCTETSCSHFTEDGWL